MLFREQAERYMQTIQTRRRKPVRPGTARIYQSFLDAHILPALGDKSLKIIENGVAKAFVAKLNAAGLAPATVVSIFKVVEGVLASAQDQNGNELYPRKWNHDFIDLPVINKADQDTPTVTPEQVNAAVSSASGQDQALLVLLASSGLRIGEALALQAYPDDGLNRHSIWDSKNSLLRIKSTLARGKVSPEPKTEAGRREIDLHPNVNEYLKATNLPKEGFLFQNSNGNRVRIETLYEHFEDLGIPGFHSLRRFRITHLEAKGVPRGLAMLWTGHASKDVHESYLKFGPDMQVRKDWAQKAGFGFELPKIGE